MLFIIEINYWKEKIGRKTSSFATQRELGELGLTSKF